MPESKSCCVRIRLAGNHSCHARTVLVKASAKIAKLLVQFIWEHILGPKHKTSYAREATGVWVGHQQGHKQQMEVGKH